MTGDGTVVDVVVDVVDVVDVVVDEVVVVTSVVDVVGGVVEAMVVIDVVASFVLGVAVELVSESDAHDSSNCGATMSAHHNDRRQVTMLPRSVRRDHDATIGVRGSSCA